MKLLIVDDEVGICDILQGFFSDRGYDTIVANRGEDALKLIEEEQPRLMLLDVRMPGMSGVEVLRQAREIRPELKVIMVTAVESDDVMELTQEYGAVDYITKPFDLDYLRKVVLTKTLALLSPTEEIPGS